MDANDTQRGKNIDYVEPFSEKDKEFLERLEKGEKPKDTDFIP